MKQTITKVTVSALLALVCLALFASSAQAVQIRADTGGALPSSIVVNENLTVLITDDAGTHIDGVAENARVRYILPADGGTPIPVDVGSDGKTVNPYKPPMTGVLNITVSYGTTLMASRTVNVTPIAIRAEAGGALPDSILVDETFTVLITEDGSPVGADTTVTFTLPYGTGDPVYVSTDVDGKARYKPPITGTLGIRVLDGLATVAEATVEVTTETGITKQLGRVEISPDSADLLIGDTQLFYATCYATDATGGGTISDCTVTWNCDSLVIGTINSSTRLFTATGVGTATVTASATYEYVTETDTAIVNVSAPTETVHVDGDDFPETSVNAGTAATITVNGTFDHNVTGNIPLTSIADPEAEADSYTLTAGNDEALLGLTVTPDVPIRAELANGNDTIRIEICYNATELASKGINPGTLALWRFNESTNVWVKMVADTPPCVANGITGNCVWIEVNNLSKFALVGTKTIMRHRGGGGGGGGATYPPGWYETPGATPRVTPGATPGVTPGATPRVTPTPKKPVTAGTAATAAEGATAGAAAKKKTPGFEAVFAIAGLLAIAYVLMRRRE